MMKIFFLIELHQEDMIGRKTNDNILAKTYIYYIYIISLLLR